MKRIAQCDLVVIGGGASGLMAACQAAMGGCSVLVLDANRQLGRKLRITGKGRCNLTNNCTVSEFMQNVPDDGRFLYSALSRFSPQDVMAFFEANGVPLKTERGARVFPCSDRADDIADCLVRLCETYGVKRLKTRADGIVLSDGAVSSVHTGEGMISCKAACRCTGGLSYPLTGSDGTGYKIAQALGHTLVQPRPSLVPLESDDAFCRELQGFSLKNVTLRAFEDGRLIYQELGEMLFTHFGVSGPLVLSASALVAEEPEGTVLSIDLKPGLSEEQLDARLLRDLGANAKKTFVGALYGLLPQKLLGVVLEAANIDGTAQAGNCTKAQRRALVETLKGLKLHVTQARPIAEAIVTRGGVSVREVNPSTMESKKIANLYFAGELLDTDAFTGGFNLQIAWSTGALAGGSIPTEV